MMFANEYEIQGYLARFNYGDTPNLNRASVTLYQLMQWTNQNSDGWAYWPKPCRAAKRLQEALYDADLARWDGVEDMSDADLKKALAPIKAFLTRQGVDHSEVIA